MQNVSLLRNSDAVIVQPIHCHQSAHNALHTYMCIGYLVLSADTHTVEFRKLPYQESYDDLYHRGTSHVNLY